MIKNKFYISLNNLVFVTAVLFMLLGRPFSGVYVLNYRLGEYLVAFGLVLLLSELIKNLNSYIKIKKYDKFFALHFFLVISFIISLLVKQEQFINPYVFRSSNYIWTISYIYLGIYLFKNFKPNMGHILFLNLILMYSYIISIISYPQFLSNFFIKYSDKFDYPKAHLHVLFFVVVTILNSQYLKNKKFNVLYFIILSSLFFPIFIFKSRGSFLAVAFYFLLTILFNCKYLKKSVALLAFTLLISSFIFIVSSTYVSDSNLTSEGGAAIVSEIFENKNTQATFLSFYIDENRVYSKDGNINWRLQIWQDVIKNSFEYDQIFFGSGFSNKIPAMQDPSRSGYDGTNENVHNYFVNIIARGGYVQFLIISLIYLYIFKNFAANNRNVLLLTMPILIVSFFDASMENPHFPFVFYLFLGFLSNYSMYNKSEGTEK